MNLHELRTPHPLRDSDFAAIRAHVKAELAQRKDLPWLAILLRLAFTASLFVLFVPYVRDRVPNVPVQIAAKHSGPPASPPAVVAASRAATPGGRRDAPRAAAETAGVRPEAAATRIEIITSDPTIRIIWLTPKENS